jgi:hypothetical protein
LSRAPASSSTCCAKICARAACSARSAQAACSPAAARVWPGLLEVAESLLRVPARLGYPVPLSRMPDELIQPEFSTAIGMLLYTHRTSVLRAADDQGLRAKLRAIFAGSL